MICSGLLVQKCIQKCFLISLSVLEDQQVSITWLAYLTLDIWPGGCMVNQYVYGMVEMPGM